MIGPHAPSGRMRDHFDWPLFIAAALVAVLGVVNLYSATSVYAGSSPTLAEMYINQLYWLAIGGVAGALVVAVDYHHIERLAFVIYTLGVFGLILVFILGRDVRGAARWIELGSFRFQPSEFMKICLVIAMAKFLHDDAKSEERTLRDLAIPAVLTAVPALLVARQPDLGTALLLVLVFLTIASITRLRLRSLLAFVGTALVAVPIAWQYALPYQRARVTAFLNPAADLSGTGYHAYHARVAIGNGGILGQGFMSGMQNQYRFLPDQYSDFPFPVFAEEWGFVGSLVLLGLYAFLVLWSVRIAAQARDRFGAVLAVGCGAIIFWHTVFNLGMASGLLPVVGITLPLFSYGGSSVTTVLLAVALLMNVSVRRYVGVSTLDRL
ncbi:MAG: rod shape-determining protein RodA [Deltaproteobacteria bacterium]|nr:rod shape-determining protein RodA [Deltaproteobacteria bacterium]